MKNFLKSIVIVLLTLESRLVLWRFKPKIIAVVGSVGKTSAKDAIYTALKDSLYIRKNQKSFGNELGIPLTILGLQNAWNNYFHWVFNIIKGFVTIFSFRYPKWLVLEVSIDRPGDMDAAGTWLKPTVVVLTRFPDVPAHVEYFASPEEVIAEKKKILGHIRPEGSIIANADDEAVMQAARDARSKVKSMFTYGFGNEADVLISNEQVMYEMIDGHEVPTGMSFKVNHQGNSVPLSLHGVAGVQHIYPLAASIAVGLAINVPMLSMTEALRYHRAPKGRMNILDGINHSVILDDSYNASPEAMTKAIEALVSLKTKGKRIAVLGDMLEIGRFTAREHRRMGELIAKKKIDYLFAVGMRAQDIVDAAMEAGMDDEHVFHFNESSEAGEILAQTIESDDVILVKGSQGMRMEKIVEAIMVHPERKNSLLVRQDKGWRN